MPRVLSGEKFQYVNPDIGWPLSALHQMKGSFSYRISFWSSPDCKIFTPSVKYTIFCMIWAGTSYRIWLTTVISRLFSPPTYPFAITFPPGSEEPGRLIRSHAEQELPLGIPAQVQGCIKVTRHHDPGPPLSLPGKRAWILRHTTPLHPTSAPLLWMIRAWKAYLFVWISAPEVQRSVERVSHNHGAIRAHLAAVEAQSVATHLADTHLVWMRRHQTSAGRRALGFWFTEHADTFIIYIYTP